MSEKNRRPGRYPDEVRERAVRMVFDHQAEDVLQWVDHTFEKIEAESCLVQIRSEDLGRLAMTVARIALTVPVAVIEPAELADTVEQLATHLTVSPPRR